MKLFSLCISFVLLCLFVRAQNLVPNGGFEQYNNCPNAQDQIQSANGWENFCLTPDYFNSCATDPNFSVPYNFYGSYQPASNGRAYAGVFTYYSAWPWSYNNRENIAYQLTSTLVTGTKYYVSFKASLAFNNFSAYCATNNLGAKFTTQSYASYATDSVNSPLTNNFAHVYSTSIITDSVNWVTIKGSFVADSAYAYIVIGNFFDDAHTDSIAPNGASACQAYYYIDEVCVSTDSTTCDFTTGIGDYNLQSNINVFPNPCTDYFEITMPENYALRHKTLSIRLSNVYGQQIFNNVVENNIKIRIATDKTPKGTHLLQIEAENKNILNKVIIIN